MEQIRCPNCGRRLFYASSDFSGMVSVKCSRCKTLTVYHKASEPSSPAPAERKS